MSLLLDGLKVSQVHRKNLKTQVDDFRVKFNRSPGLGVILVGENPASQVYVRNKLKSGRELGFTTKQLLLAADCTQADLENAIENFNLDREINGFLVQLPLPKGLDGQSAISKIDPKKDADALTAENAGLFWLGEAPVTPCTPTGVMSILRHYGYEFEGKEAIVVGRSEIVGKPMAQMLLQANATVTICHSKTRNLRQHCLRGDLVVVAAGQPEMIGRNDIKEGAWVVDVGIHRKSGGSLVGDCRFSELEAWAGAVTPVPGGVGPMTITSLMQNTLKLAELQLGV